MNYKKHAILRGYDLFFKQASEQNLNAICKELGDKSKYDTNAQSVTNMLTNDILIDLSKLADCHEVANIAGKYFGKKYDCIFVASELYIKMNIDQSKILNKNGVNLIYSN